MSTRCRTPKKIRYPSEGAAIKALKGMPYHVRLHNMPYKCTDHWHVGRYTKKTKWR